MKALKVSRKESPRIGQKRQMKGEVVSDIIQTLLSYINSICDPKLEQIMRDEVNNY